MSELHNLEAIAEYLRLYVKSRGNMKAPSQETLRTFQNAYRREAMLQKGIRFENEKLRSQGREKDIKMAEVDLTDYHNLLDQVVAKMNA